MTGNNISLEETKMMVLLVFLLIPVVFANPAPPACTPPQVSNIPVQSGFDFDKFSDNGSKWYLVLYNKMISVPGMNVPLNESNVFFRFFRNSSNELTGKMVGRVRLNKSIPPFCTSQKSKITQSTEEPAKLHQTFNNPFSTKPLTFHYWILQTDYSNMAVVFACQKELGDGTCSPGDTYLWTLSRTPNHTPAEMGKIDKLATSVCLKKFRKVNHQSPCTGK
ncbi:retinol-binding protein 4-A-like [Saccostrea echinata]|uniref:retinol-binding protein 4-A-like n=1 Tax=Saccostrea echinata TaxID=191078 RepID=UPI002A80F862|nr:retinol-binding protein 4-A-like [Saccostrea echinata]